MADISIIPGHNLQNSNTVLNKGNIIVNSNRSSEFLFIQSGTVTVNDSDTAQNNYISSAAQLNVNNRGSADNNYISSGEILTINNDGTVNSNYIYSSDILSINGGSANNTSINMGEAVKSFSDSVAENNYIYSAGVLNIFSGASVGITSISAKASLSENNFSTTTLNSTAQFFVQSGALLHDMTLSGQGSFVIGSDGSANNML